MSYSVEQFKNDIIINIEADSSFSISVLNALRESEFKFVDSKLFSKREWNTYSRIIKLLCSTKNKSILDGQKKRLYSYMDQFHGVHDEYMLVDLLVFASSDKETVTITSDKIIINKHIEIDKTNNWIGTGGFASVYKVDDEETGISYAYKIFDPSPFQNSDSDVMKKRFLREAKKVLGYSHENIVNAYDFGFLGNDSGYIKLEYITGKKIIDYVKDVDLSENDKLKLATQYVSAMSYIHSKADIHRDISYSNVMVDSNGVIKVLDFGFARGTEDTEYDTAYQDIIHKFSPPDTTYTIRTEVYCIGAILFSIYSQDDFHITKLTDKIFNDKRIYEIVNKCLKSNPQERYQNAIEVENALKAVLTCSLSEMQVDLTPSYVSLDSFEKKVKELAKIEFDIGKLPTESTIKDWIEVRVPNFIETYTFRSNINFKKLINQIAGVCEITEYKNVNYDIDKSLIENIYDSYCSLSEKNKTLLIKGLLTIILEKSEETFELPFD